MTKGTYYNKMLHFPSLIVADGLSTEIHHSVLGYKKGTFQQKKRTQKSYTPKP